MKPPSDEEAAMLACFRARHIAASEQEGFEHPDRWRQLCDPVLNPAPSLADVREYLNPARAFH